MIKVKKEGIVLEQTNLEFEDDGVLNPGCIQEGNSVHMFYRAVKKGNYSSIGYCRLDGPLKVVERAKRPVLFSEYKYEEHGVEDPRIVYINGTYYLFYMAYDGKDVSVAYATSKNLKHFEKKGPVSHYISYAEAKEYFIKSSMASRYFDYSVYDKSERDTAENVYIWGKDAFMFPKKINGRFALLHRTLPGIQVIYFKKFSDLTISFWREHLKQLSRYVVLEPRYWFESRAIGAGAPPIETKKGWLLIYHAIENSPEGKIYRACAALLDKKNPCKVIGRLNYPLFSPEEEWELKGTTNNVVFPTGTAVFGKRLYIYYGAADSKIGAVSVDLDKLVKELMRSKS